MKLLTILSLSLLPLLAAAQTKPVKRVSLKDSVIKYSTMVAAYKRMSGFPKYDSVRYKIVRLHDSAQVIGNKWSALYEDSVYRAKMKF
jgi:hypothetical protein